jgi:hypothetical protein
VSGAESFAAGADNAVTNSYSGAIGRANTVAADDSFAVGISNTINGSSAAFASGSNSTVTGFGSAVVGDRCSVAGRASYAVCQQGATTGDYSYATGLYVIDHGVSGITAFASAGNPRLNQGGAQSETYVLTGTTSGAGAVTLTTNGSAPAGNNIMVMADRQTSAIHCDIAIADRDAGKSWGYSLTTSLFQRGAGGAGTVTAASGNPAAGTALTIGSPAALQAAPAFVADTTNGGVYVTFTAPAGNTHDVYGVARCVAAVVGWH